jgi:RNA polymerase sigma factor (sigma-70 family)
MNRGKQGSDRHREDHSSCDSGIELRLDGRCSGSLASEPCGPDAMREDDENCCGHSNELAHSLAELVDQIRARDDSVWRDLIDRYEPLLRSIARGRGLSAEDALDAMQLTWLRCLQHIDQLTHADRLGGWLTTICRRECNQLIAKTRREVPLTEPDAAWLIGDRHEECDPCAEVARRDEHDRLYRAITALPDRQRMVLAELLRPESQSYLDVSHRLGLPLGSIGPTWQRAVIRLRRDPRLAGPAAETSRCQLQGEENDVAASHKTLVRS